MNIYDIIIIGSGPAGLYCGKLLSSKYKVSIITNKEIGSYKPCGGLLSERAKNYVDKLNIDESFYSYPSILNADIYYAGNWTKQKFYNIERKLLEIRIYESFNENVELVKSNNYIIKKEKNKYRIDINNTNKKIYSEILIIADGANSKNRKSLGFGKASIIKVEQIRCKKNIDNAKLINDNSLYIKYYYWIIPKNDEMLIGYNKEDRDIVVNDIENKFKIKIPNDSNVVEKGFLTKIENIDEIELGGKNIFIIGEAAGLVLPESGEGLTSAFESAENLAKILLNEKIVDKNTEYKKSMHKRINTIERDLKYSFSKKYDK